MPRRRLMRGGQLDGAGEPQPFLHGCYEKAAAGRAHRQIEAHVVGRQHDVIAALGDQRRVEAQETGQLARRPASGDDNGLRRQLGVRELDRGDLVALASEAARAAAQHDAAVGGEAFGERGDHLVGIDGVHAVRVVDAAHDVRAQTRRQVTRPRAVDDLELGALGLLQLALVGAGGEGLLALIDVERALAEEELAQSRGLDLGLPGDVGLGHQGAEGIDALPDLGGAIGGERKARHPR